MQAFSKFNHSVKYLLAVIDVFSNKMGKSVASTIFKERKPEEMWVDKDKEFYKRMSNTRLNCIPPRTRKNLAWLRGGLER